MAIEVSGGLVEKLESFKKKSKEKRFARAQRKIDRKLKQGAYARPDGKMRAGYSEAYAEGWDRIFGKKTGDDLQGVGAGVSEAAAADLRHEDPAAGDQG